MHAQVLFLSNLLIDPGGAKDQHMLDPGLCQQGFDLARLHSRNAGICHKYIYVALTRGYEFPNLFDLVLDI